MGYLYIALTVLFWGIAAILDKTALRSVNPYPGLVVRSTAVFTILLITTLFFFRSTFSLAMKLPTKVIVYLALSGVFAGVLGVLTYFFALKQFPASKVVPLCSIYPLVAALGGMLFLKEEFSILRLVGVIVIIIGVWLVK